MYLGQSTFEEASLGGVGRQSDRLAVGGSRLPVPAETAEEIGAGGGEEVVRGELTAGREGVEEAEARGGAFGHGDGDGVVQGDDRGGEALEEEGVERGDLAPIGVGGARSARVDGGDRGLERVGARWAAAERPLDEREALGDLRVVPSRAVLILEQD